ncbi:hypothetical protein KALB_7509 [Kutzneria albida DSM 43870]|uniref:histidine kinase n=1 Tax=Kutzneria albida DSM 43870 TaxID=1449976 RepID=W5WJV8_9PSEU|nr:hypothetical protein KALB_7509 [Kutzneria albida DSM 43870]
MGGPPGTSVRCENVGDGWFNRVVLRPLVAASTWRAMLHLLGASLWSTATVAVLLTGLLLSVASVPLLFYFIYAIFSVSTVYSGIATALLAALVLLIVPAFVATGYVVDGCTRLESTWYRNVLGVDLPVALRLPTEDMGLWRRFRTMITDALLWRLVLYTVIRWPLALLTATAALAAWVVPLSMVIAGVGYFIAYSVNTQRAPAEGLLSWVLMIVVVPLAPYATRLLTRVHVWLARRFVSRMSAGQLEARVGEVEQRRLDAMDAAEAERRRIERNLHDGAQQQLVALAMMLGRARRKFDTDPEGTRALLDEAHRNAKEAIVELRELTRGLVPPVLTDRGLDAALSALAARSQIPVAVEYDVPARAGRTVESIAYFMISESLANTAKHAHASRACVLVRRTGGVLRVEVRDDGVGGATATPGSGLAGLADRAAGVDGTLAVYSPEGGPTTIIMELPCES